MAKFELLEGTGLNWPALTPATLARLRSSLSAGWRVDEDGRRFGFREVRPQRPGVFVAFFAVHSSLPYWTYDDAGNPVHEVVPDSFERVLTVFFALEGRFLLHDRRFFRTDLNKEKVRSLWRRAFDLALFDADLGPLTALQPYTEESLAATMLQRLRDDPYRVMEVQVRDLAGRTVPDGVHFYNPDVDRDAIAHALFDGTFATVDDVRFAAARDRDVRESRVVDGVAATGTVSEYVTTSDVGRRRRVVRIRVDATIDVPLEPEELEQATTDVVDQLVERVQELFPDRFAHIVDQFEGGLFERADSGPAPTGGTDG